MNIAVFVDAGYLYASTCIARFGVNQPRLRVNLNIDAAVAQLKHEVAALDGGGNRLIRIYWYDGAPLSGKTADQTYTGSLPDVKLRLGTVNYYGQQKGVDALIAHDLSELARNRAIDAAIIVSGDEDILVGVQTAQSFGVRVHILGIAPARSQSEKLMHEADMCHEWAAGLVAPWISLKSAPIAVRPHAGNGDDPELRRITTIPEMVPILTALEQVVEGREAAIFDNWERGQRISQDIDRELMKTLSGVLGRQLTPQEKPSLRQLFVDTLRASLEPGGHGDSPEAEEQWPAGGDAQSAPHDESLPGAGGEPNSETDDEPHGETDDEPHGETDDEPHGETDGEPHGETNAAPAAQAAPAKR